MHQSIRYIETNYNILIIVDILEYTFYVILFIIRTLKKLLTGNILILFFKNNVSNSAAKWAARKKIYIL